MLFLDNLTRRRRFTPMLTMILSYLLAAQMMAAPVPAAVPEAPAVPTPLFWGMIDPELSLWFSRTPQEAPSGRRVMWDFSWRGFLAALIGQPMLMEDAAHAPLV
jgi:hypothetical protein